MRYIETMNRLGKIAVGLATGLALNAGLRAAAPVSANAPVPSGNLSQENPYLAIATRNIFGLNPPAPPAPPEDPTKDLPKITPTGIMGVFGKLQVLFKVAPVGKAAPGAKEESYILSQGQMQDEITVVNIDEKNGLVTFDNHGTTQQLPLNSGAAAGGTAPAFSGGMHPAAMPGAPGAHGNNGGTSVALFGADAVGRNGGGPNGNPGSNGGGQNGANGGLGFGNSATPMQIYQPEPTQLTPEAAQIGLAGNHLQAIVNNDPSAPLFPPSAIDKEAGIPSNTEPAPPLP